MFVLRKFYTETQNEKKIFFTTKLVYLERVRFWESPYSYHFVFKYLEKYTRASDGCENFRITLQHIEKDRNRLQQENELIKAKVSFLVETKNKI